jgi:hypothetical protein
VIKLNRKDGQTLSFDLTCEKDNDALNDILGNKESMEAITGIGCLHNTFWHALTKPKKFRNVQFSVEQLLGKKEGETSTKGERIICQADDIQLTILIYHNVRPKMTRIEMKKIGKLRFVPKKGKRNGSDTEECE